MGCKPLKVVHQTHPAYTVRESFQTLFPPSHLWFSLKYNGWRRIMIVLHLPVASFQSFRIVQWSAANTYLSVTSNTTYNANSSTTCDVCPLWKYWDKINEQTFREICKFLRKVQLWSTGRELTLARATLCWRVWSFQMVVHERILIIWFILHLIHHHQRHSKRQSNPTYRKQHVGFVLVHGSFIRNRICMFQNTHTLSCKGHQCLNNVQLTGLYQLNISVIQ